MFSAVLGPSTGGALVQAVGFPCLMVFIGVINILYAPLCFLLRNPAVREEKMVKTPHEIKHEVMLFTKNYTTGQKQESMVQSEGFCSVPVVLR